MRAAHRARVVSGDGAHVHQAAGTIVDHDDAQRVRVLRRLHLVGKVAPWEGALSVVDGAAVDHDDAAVGGVRVDERSARVVRIRVDDACREGAFCGAGVGHERGAGRERWAGRERGAPRIALAREAPRHLEGGHRRWPS